MANFIMIILLVFLFFMIYVFVDEFIEYRINKKLEHEFELEKRKYYGKFN